MHQTAVGDILEYGFAVDRSSGTVFELYSQYDANGSTTSVWAKRYTRTGGWETPVLLESSANDATYAAISLDASGNATALLTLYNSSVDRLYAARYSASTQSWSAAAPIDNGASNVEGFVGSDLVTTPGGEVFAIWKQANGVGGDDLWVNRYTSGSGWGTPALLDNLSGNVVHFMIPSDFDGGNTVPTISANPMVVWSQHNGTYTSLYASRYAAGAWSTPVPIAANTGNVFNTNFTVTLDTSGNTFVAWSQSDGATFTSISTWANRYSANGSSWGTATLLETETQGLARAPTLEADAAGNALVVWNMTPVSGSGPVAENLYASRYIAGTGWDTTPTIVQSGAQANGAIFTENHQIAFDASGNATVAWTAYDAAGSRYNAYASRYAADTGSWTTPILIESSNDTVTELGLAVNQSGEALVVLGLHNDTANTGNIYWNKYAAGSWSTPTLLESASGDALQAYVWFENNGDAMSVWAQDDGTYYRTYSKRYR